jgi:hypothetical protein
MRRAGEALHEWRALGGAAIFRHRHVMCAAASDAGRHAARPALATVATDVKHNPP